MALIKKDNIIRKEKEKNTLHRPVQATYTVFEKEGRKLFQIDTYGLPGREMPDKISQSIQFDKEMAEYLVELLSGEFKL